MAKTEAASPASKWWILLALLPTLFLFLPSLDHEWVYDDREQILQNTRMMRPDYPRLAFFEDLWRFRTPDPDAGKPGGQYYRPINGLYFWANWQLFGERPRGWHAVSVLLHLVVTALVYRLGRRLALAPPAAAAAALLFGLHPIHAESVAWVSGSTDLILATFVLASVLTAGAAGRPWISVAFFALAALSKETAYVLPPLFAVWRWFELDESVSFRRRLTQSGLAMLPYLIVAAVVFAVRWRVIGFLSKPLTDDALTLPQALVTLPRVLVEYVGMIVLSAPAGLGHGIVVTPSWIAPAFWVPLLALLVLAAVWLRTRLWTPAERVLLIVGVGLPLIPVLNLTLLIPDALVQDRYVYLSTAFWIPLLLVAAARIADRRRLARSTAAAVVVALAVLAGIRLVRLRDTFRDEIALFSRAVADAPDHGIFRHRLGLALLGANRVQEAAVQLDAAVRLEPNDWVNPVNLALAYDRLGKTAEAAEARRRALAAARRSGELATEPRFARIFAQVGDDETRLGQLERALDSYRAGTAQDPAFAPAWMGLARTALELGRMDEALAAAQRLVTLVPGDGMAQVMLASVLARSGRVAEAEATIETAIGLAPDRPEPRFVRAQIRLAGGKTGDALADLEGVQQRFPDYRPAAELLAALRTTRR